MTKLAGYEYIKGNDGKNKLIAPYGGPYSLHNVGKLVEEATPENEVFKSNSSTPLNYGDARRHFPVIGYQQTLDPQGNEIEVPIIGYGANLEERRVNRPVYWPHLRTENRIKALGKDGEKKYPHLFKFLTDLMNKQRLDYDEEKAYEENKGRKAK